MLDGLPEAKVLALAGTPGSRVVFLLTSALRAVKRTAAALLVLALAAAAVAASLFPRAFPILAIRDLISRDVALQRADSFIAAHGLAPDSARRAIQFTADDSLRTFIEIAGGGKDSLDALLRGRDVALYSWSVRAFVPGDAGEARVRLSPDGRIIGARRTLPDSLVRPSLDEAGARRLADSVITGWLGDSTGRWTLTASSYASRTPSGRIDHTFTYERSDRRVADAPLRLDVVIAGDLVAEARPYVRIPESFGRRYSEMRSANALLSIFSTLGVLGLFVGTMIALRRYAQLHVVRWRAPLLIGGIAGALVTAAVLNQMPSGWYGYDTAGSPELYQVGQVVIALLGGAGTMLMLTLTLAGAEALTRQAFPWHLDWWQYWRYRGTREVASRVGGGYVAAALGFAYVTTFYLITRSAFGWWVPSELIDDPNMIATPLPWVTGIGLAFQAAVLEESLFRAVPLSLIALWAAPRKDRDRWMAAGVVATALLFGFAHSDYPSWPPYSRGVEIFLEACVWGVLFLRFGILVPMVAHFVYNLVLFGLFATAGSGAQYRYSLLVLVLALAAPALSIAWAVWRQRGWKTLGSDAYFREWAAPTIAPVASVSQPAGRPVLRHGRRVRFLAASIPVIAVLVVLLAPPSRIAGPRFTASSDRAAAVADSLLRSRGTDPAAWRRLTGIGSDTQATWRRFLARHDAESLATTLAHDYAIPAWWVMRYVRTDAPLAERAEEWRVRVLPDGRPLDVRHLIPEQAPRLSVTPDSVRSLARASLEAAGYHPGRLVEVKYEADRPAPHDATVTFVDTSLILPDAATARAWVAVAGDEVLFARRGVELPQAFIRETRSADERGMAVTALFGLPAIGLLIWGIVRSRRQPFVVNDELSARSKAVLLSVLVLTSVGSTLQSLPSAISGYDTSVPWSTFVTTVVTFQVMSLAGVLLLIVFWLLANGLRRRAGIPLVAGTSSNGISDDVLAALALGGVPVVMGLLRGAIASGGVPSAPTTLLHRAVPLLAPATNVLSDAIAMVLGVAIGALAIRGFSERRPVRRLVAAVVLTMAVGAVIGGQLATGATVHGPRVAWSVITGATLVLTLITWGRVSVLSWVMAAIFMGSLNGLRAALHAPTGIERAAHLIAVLVSVVMFAAGVFMARRPAIVLRPFG